LSELGGLPFTAEGRLGELFLKARLGWREIDLGSKGERRAELWEAQRNAIEDEKRGLDAKLARLAQGLKVVETGGSSAG
jgi:hypothetical protein